MCLEDVAGKLLRELGGEGTLEWAGRDDDLVGRDRTVLEFEAETRVVALLEPPDFAIQLDGQLEGLGMVLKVGDHLIACRVAVGITRERQARQRAVAPGREESQRFPALAPGRANRIGALEERKTASLAAEEVAHR